MTVLRRSATVLAAVLGVMAAFVAGFVVASAQSGTQATPLRLTGQDLGSGRSCASLLQWYVDHAVDRVTAWGWNSPIMYDGVAVPPAGPLAGGVAGSATGRESLDTATGSDTGTNVQESGVDEPDTVKVSGTLLVRVVDDTLTTYDVSGRRPHELGAAPLLGMSGAQLLFVGNRVVAIGSDPVSPQVGPYYGQGPQATWVRTFDVSDPARPTEVDSRRYAGTLITARQTGAVVRLVLSSTLPNLPFVAPDARRTSEESLRANQAVVRRSTITDWLPTVTVGDGDSQQAVPCSSVAVPDTFGGLGTMSVVGFDAATPGATSVTGVATGSQLAYVSTDHLYVATSPDQMIWGCCRELTPQMVDQATDLYAFDLSGTSARYVGAGSVDGRIADARSMDEYDGVLRVAIGSVGGVATNSVVLLRPESGRLVEVGRLDGLGVDQQIRSMRWFDGLAVMVTFQQVDPFYVLDLADPAHPRVVGVLHLPGWSSYLHPVGRHLILGLGQTGPSGIQVEVPPVPMPPVPQSTPQQLPPRRGPSLAPSAPNATFLPKRGPTGPEFLPVERAKATLFDIGDLTHPRAVGTVRYPRGSIAQAGLDPHQVTWLPDTHTLLTVVTQGYAGPRAWISVLRIHAGALHGHLIPVNASAGTDTIRTVPLDDGRVLLVTPTSVRFLAV